MSKTGVCAGHYDGANTIPSQFRTKPEYKEYSEGTAMRALAKAICKAQPAIYNARPEAGTANPWHPDWRERAARLKAAGCDYAFELHTNWSVNGKGAPNRGIFLVIVSPCYEAGVNQAKACEAEKALALKLWKPLADGLGLKFEIRTRKGGGNWDYYSFINFCKRQGIAHPMIIEHGYHLDFAEHKDEWTAKVAAYYETVQKLTGGQAAAGDDPGAPEPDPKEYDYFVTTKDCLTLWSISKKFGVPIDNILLPGGRKPDAGAMREGMTVQVWYKLPVQPVYFTTTADCYTLYAVGKRYGADWQALRLQSGAIPNPLAMRPGIVLRVG